MIFVVIKKLVPKGYNGITIFPFVFFTHPALLQNKTLINHEKIHIRQQIELLVFPFFIWYFVEFLFKLFLYKNTFLAYKNISFEREAYQNDQNLEYLKSKKFWSFLRYLKRE
jgi:hypothetical protein